MKHHVTAFIACITLVAAAQAVQVGLGGVTWDTDWAQTTEQTWYYDTAASGNVAPDVSDNPYDVYYPTYSPTQTSFRGPYQLATFTAPYGQAQGAEIFVDGTNYGLAAELKGAPADDPWLFVLVSFKSSKAPDNMYLGVGCVYNPGLAALDCSVTVTLSELDAAHDPANWSHVYLLQLAPSAAYSHIVMNFSRATGEQVYIDEMTVQTISVPDCNNNGVVDIQETDCNANGVPDDCDITSGDSLDDNANGVPDECESILLGDVNCDGAVNAFDIDPFVVALVNADDYAAAYPNCDVMTADCNDDGAVNAFDIDPFVIILVGGN